MGSDPQKINYSIILAPQPDPPNADPIYAAIGKVIARWGLFENQLDFGLMSILEIPDAEPIRPRLTTGEPIPVSFKQKVILWRKAFRRIPILVDHQQPALILIKRAKELAGRRDSIVHGNWNNFRLGEPLQIVGVHFRLKGDKMTMTEHVAAANGFNQIADSILELSTEMARFLGFVHRVLHPEGNGKSSQ